MVTPYKENRYPDKRRNSWNTNKDGSEAPEEILTKANFDESWITEGANERLPDFAEVLGKYMARNGLTNSKIRSIYGEIKRIQMGKFEIEKASFFLLRPKVAYAFGRDEKNKGLKLIKLIFERVYLLVKDQKTYNNFCNLIEAILAYHKAYGGKD